MSIKLNSVLFTFEMLFLYMISRGWEALNGSNFRWDDEHVSCGVLIQNRLK